MMHSSDRLCDINDLKQNIDGLAVAIESMIARECDLWDILEEKERLISEIVSKTADLGVFIEIREGAESEPKGRQANKRLH